MFIKINDDQIFDTDAGITYTLKSYENLEGLGLVRLVIEKLGHEGVDSVSTSYNRRISKSEYTDEKRKSDRARAIFNRLEGLCDEAIEVALGTIPAQFSPF